MTEPKTILDCAKALAKHDQDAVDRTLDYFTGPATFYGADMADLWRDVQWIPADGEHRADIRTPLPPMPKWMERLAK